MPLASCRPVLAIHGGAGGTLPPHIPPRLKEAYRASLRRALDAGYAILDAGGSALDAATRSVQEMEDDVLFNAAHGAVFTTKGTNECEASVMVASPSQAAEVHATAPLWPSAKPSDRGPRDVQTRRCASAVLVRNTKNPIMLAKTLLQGANDNPHVVLSGRPAEEIGWKRGCERSEDGYYYTRRRWLEHRRDLGLPDDDMDGSYNLQKPAKGREESALSNRFEPNHDQSVQQMVGSSVQNSEAFHDYLPKGTVGAVALDKHGQLAVATSTGGKTNKLPGRIGDTPTPGAGFWAQYWPAEGRAAGVPKPCDGSLMAFLTWFALLLGSVLNSLSFSLSKPDPHPLDEEKAMLIHNEHDDSAPAHGVAVSGTGDGDYFLRTGFASIIAHRMRYLNESAGVACQRAIDELGALGGVGGCIAVDQDGQVHFHLNSSTMNRGFIDELGRAKVAIYADEELR